MSRPTQAIVVADDRSLEFREVYLNEIQPDEVLVEIQASGVCHTDLSCAGNLLPTPLGAVLGHEGKCSFPFFSASYPLTRQLQVPAP